MIVSGATFLLSEEINNDANVAPLTIMRGG
jgi:hypothetical protein